VPLDEEQPAAPSLGSPDRYAPVRAPKQEDRRSESRPSAPQSNTATASPARTPLSSPPSLHNAPMQAMQLQSESCNAQAKTPPTWYYYWRCPRPPSAKPLFQRNKPPRICRILPRCNHLLSTKNPVRHGQLPSQAARKNIALVRDSMKQSIIAVVCRRFCCCRCCCCCRCRCF